MPSDLNSLNAVFGTNHSDKFLLLVEAVGLLALCNDKESSRNIRIREIKAYYNEENGFTEDDQKALIEGIMFLWNPAVAHLEGHF